MEAQPQSDSSFKAMPTSVTSIECPSTKDLGIGSPKAAGGKSSKSFSPCASCLHRCAVLCNFTSDVFYAISGAGQVDVRHVVLLSHTPLELLDLFGQHVDLRQACSTVYGHLMTCNEKNPFSK